MKRNQKIRDSNWGCLIRQLVEIKNFPIRSEGISFRPPPEYISDQTPNDFGWSRVKSSESVMEFIFLQTTFNHQYFLQTNPFKIDRMKSVSFLLSKLHFRTLFMNQSAYKNKKKEEERPNSCLLMISTEKFYVLLGKGIN